MCRGSRFITLADRGSIIERRNFNCPSRRIMATCAHLASRISHLASRIRVDDDPLAIRIGKKAKPRRRVAVKLRVIRDAPASRDKASEILARAARQLDRAAGRISRTSARLIFRQRCVLI